MASVSVRYALFPNIEKVGKSIKRAAYGSGERKSSNMSMNDAGPLNVAGRETSLSGPDRVMNASA